MLTIILVILLSSGGPVLGQTAPFFDDVPSNKPYYNHVNLIRIRFITTGCSFVPSNYCPEVAPSGELTRGQAAVLVIRSIYSATTGNPEGYPYSTSLPQYFYDVPSWHPQYVYIQKLAELGITSGCGGGNFCPDQPLDYAQLATWAVRARMVREYGSVSTLECSTRETGLSYYNCNPYFYDVQPADWSFPYVQKAYELIGNQVVPPGCPSGNFCPGTVMTRGYFAIYAVSLIMKALNAAQLPNAGNLPNVTAPYNPAAGFTMTCEAAQQNLQTTNQFVAVDANNVFAWAGTSFWSTPQWPSLWMTYAWRQLSGPAPPAPAVLDGRLGNATSLSLQSATFGVSTDQTYTHTTKHGVISGCVSPPPAEWPAILSTRTETISLTTQVVTTSPPGLSLTVDNAWCGTPCTYAWLSGTGHVVSGALSQNLGGAQYSFGNWSDGGTSTHTHYTPGVNSQLVATYFSAGGPYTVSGQASPGAGGAVSPASGSYNSGNMVTFQATPTSGYVFDYWSITTAFGVTTSRANPLYLAVNSETQVVASFRAAAVGSLSCFASQNPVTTGGPVTLVAVVSGISQPSYLWSGAVAGSQSSVSFTPNQPGGYLGKVSANGLAAYCYVAAASPAMSTLHGCIGSSGSGATCEIPPGVHIVPPQFGGKASSAAAAVMQSYLHIGRSNFTITGTLVSGSTDTILRRGTWYSGGEPPPWPPAIWAEFLIEAPSQATNVTIRNLLFDGNRYAPGLNCLAGNAPYYDLEVSRGGKFTLESLQFINAPGTAVHLSGSGSSISMSTFGHGYTRAGEPTLSGEQTATRSTAIWMDGTNNAALFNSIHFAGTAGINLNGTGQFAYGNTLFKNRYEISDGTGGGQLFLAGGSADALVAGNVIYGGQWPPENSAGLVLETQCSLPSPNQQYNAGVEGYGFGHFFFNNEVADHTGSGMQFAASNPTGRITISSAPDDPADTTQRFIEGNADGGVVFLGQNWCNENNHSPCHVASGVTLDAVFVGKNRKGSLALDLNNNQSANARIMDKEANPPVSALYTGFFNGSCLSGNTNGDNQPVDTPLFGQALSRPLPGSMTSYVPQASPQPCPSPPWPTSIPPAAPHRPGWPW